MPAPLRKKFNEVRDPMEWLIGVLEDSDLRDAPEMRARIEEMAVEIEHMRDQKAEWDPNRSRAKNRTF